MSDGAPPSRLPEDVFNDALDLPRERRAAFLDDACAGDVALRREVEPLLELADRDASLTTPPADTVETALPGRIGRYEIVGLCGRGGMGVVYEAIDPALDRHVALKTITRVGAGSELGVERLQREARTVAGLHHPRIAVLHTLEEAAGIVFFTMELVPGRTLAERLRSGPLPPDEVARIGRQIAEGLEFAHALHVVHRDLKPANVMLQPNGDIKLLDFGIARAFDADARATASRETPHHAQTLPQGTPEYMSPEQLLGLPIDHRTDLWSLGALLYECATGTPPPLVAPERGADDGPAEERALAAGLARDVPGPLRDAILRCLRVDASQRPASATELRRALGAARARRVPWPVLAAVMALAAAAVTLFLLWPHAPLVSVEIRHGRTLHAFDAEGHEMWARAIPPDETGGLNQPLIARGRDGRLLGVGVQSDSPRGPVLRWLDPRSGRTVWARRIDWERPVNAQGQLCYEWFRLIDWPGRDTPVFAIGVRDGVWYSSAVQFVSLDNRVLGTYYHPGPLDPGPPDATRDAPDVPFFLTGDNSSARFDRTLVPFETRTHCGCVIRLDPPQVSGQAFPYSTGLPEHRDWPGLEHAKETSYLLLPPPDPHVNMYVNSMRRISQPDGSVRFEVETVSGLIVRVDGHLVPTSCYFADGMPAYTLLAGRISSVVALLLHDGRAMRLQVPVESTPVAAAPQR